MSYQFSTHAHHNIDNKKHIAENDQFDAGFKVIHIPSDNQQSICKPYNRKGLFKISVIHGKNRVYYEDKVVEIEKHAILFSRPNVVYTFEHLGDQYDGYLCVFTQDFFDKFANIINYPLFDHEVSPITEITEEHMEAFTRIFQRMEHEVSIDFDYKYDLLRTMVLQLIYDTLKQQPSPILSQRESNGALRIANQFKEILEEQFPILSPDYRMSLRRPVDFADTLSMHVNHLNRSLKHITDRTTSELIADRIIKEAKMLLQETEWNVTEIAWCLGFEDIAHFLKFFKKITKQTPRSFRKSLHVRIYNIPV